jgi:hypothetical protein
MAAKLDVCSFLRPKDDAGALAKIRKALPRLIEETNRIDNRTHPLRNGLGRKLICATTRGRFLTT